MEATIMEQMIFDEVWGRYNVPVIDGFAVGMFAHTLLVGATEEQNIVSGCFLSPELE